jgi:hypothetical protein
MKPRAMPALIAFGLLLSAAGCSRSRPLVQWVPGVYLYRSTLPGTGDVAGHIEVTAEGPLSVTSNLGPCRAQIETTPRALRVRLDGQRIGRAFFCGTDHRFSVSLGSVGGPPIEGSVSNQRTDTLTTFGETTCREYQVVESGERVERICVAWNVGPKTERRTTGASARWWLVPDSVAPRP